MNDAIHIRGQHSAALSDYFLWRDAPLGRVRGSHPGWGWQEFGLSGSRGEARLASFQCRDLYRYGL